MIIQPRFISVKNILESSELFRVPNYQRSYSWEKDHVEDFWDDLVDTSQSGEEFFLGTMVFTKDPDDSGRTIVLDGQQRLATICLFLRSARDLIEDKGGKKKSRLVNDIQDKALFIRPFGKDLEEVRLEMNQSDRYYFSRTLELGKKADGYNDGIASHRHIKEAYSRLRLLLEDRIGSSKEIEKEARKLIGTLDEKFRIMRLDAETDVDANTVFETLNDRGMELSVADLTKNFLFMLTKENIETTIRQWNHIVDRVGDENVTKYIRYYWNAKRGFIRKERAYKEIKKSINAGNVGTFLRELEKSSEVFQNLQEPQSRFWKDKRIFNGVAQLGIFGVEQPFVVILAAHSKFPKQKDLREVIEALVTLSFRYSTICNISPSKLELEYVRIAKGIRDGRMGVDEVVSELKSLDPSDKAFEESFLDFETKRSRLAKYILSSICCEMLKRKGEKELEPAKTVNLEHIIPKSPNEEWRKFFKRKGVDWANLVNRLGNQTILLEEYNKSISNKYFTDKKKMYKKSSLPLNEDLLSLREFGSRQVIDRQRDLAREAVKIWRF